MQSLSYLSLEFLWADACGDPGVDAFLLIIYFVVIVLTCCYSCCSFFVVVIVFSMLFC